MMAASTGVAEGFGPDADRPTPTRERVLTTNEFERLLLGAPQLKKDQGTEAWAAILIAGRLGLRAGELIHLSQNWVDFQQRIVRIPEQDPCTKGRDGGPCGSCRQAIEQRQRNGDEREFDAIAGDYWRPKTEAAARAVPFGWSPRAEEALSLLMERHGCWPYGYSTLKRRLNDALKAAPGLTPDLTSLHGLRGAAASYHAGHGVDKEALKAMMGWRDDSVPKKYLRIDGQMTQRSLRKVYG